MPATSPFDPSAFAQQLLLRPGDALAQTVGPALKSAISAASDYTSLRFGAPLPPETYTVAVGALCFAAMAGFVTLTALGLTLAERKVAAFFQNRKGPNRVGFWGLLQPIADMLKLLQKEDTIPRAADRPVFLMAPFVGLAATFMVLAVIPFDRGLAATDLSVGVLYVTAVSGLGVLSILMAGWSSANKYSLLGGLRSAAQIVSYELSPAMVVLSVVLFSGTLSLQGIVERQSVHWNLWHMGLSGPLGMLIFLTAGTAEINRAPFDLPEAESELTAGYHTEYSGMRFSMFQLAEFMNMFIIAALTATFFLGGWQALAPLKDLPVPGYAWFFAKTGLVMFLIMWFRWTFPRVRVDQLMKLEWKILLPLSFLNLIHAAVWAALGYGK